MRVPLLSFLRYQSQAMSSQFDKVAALQIQSTTGKKLIHASDNPLLAKNIQSVQTYLEQLNGFQMNLNLAQARIAQKNGVVAESIDLMNKTKELVIKAQNDTLSNDDRLGIAVELENIRARQLYLANAQDSNGDYLYGGFNTKTPPFQDINGAIAYLGTQDVVHIDLGLNVRLAYAEPGNTVFSDMPSGENMFDVLTSLISTLKTPLNTEEDKTVYHAALNALAGSVSTVMKDLMVYQSVTANQATLVDAQKNLYDNLILEKQTLLNHLSEADMADVLGDLTRQMTLLQVTQETYIKLQELSLSVLLNK